MIKGWNTKYSQILKEFHYKKKKDFESALRLDSLLKNTNLIKEVRKLIENQNIIIVGAGPSISSSISFLKNKKSVIIVADSAVKPVVENGIRPDIVVTDLDGDLETLKKIGKKNILFVVHAHGDNIEKLGFIQNFRKCIGTTQTKPFGKVYNFGGFTDGDRAVFLASYFNAKKIILFGMDFGNRIGKFSNTKTVDRKIKIKKLEKGKNLLEWLSTKTTSELFTTSSPLSGFKKIPYRDIDNIIT